MTGLRPTASEREPYGIETSAIIRTTTDTVRPAVAARTPNAWESSGRIGWVM